MLKKQDIGINLNVANNGYRDQSLTGIGGPRQHLKCVANGGYGRAGLGLSLDIVGQGSEQGGEQSNHYAQGGGSQVRRHRRDQAQGKR